MSWKLMTAIWLVTFGSGRCMTDLERQCVANFNEELSNEFLTGTWYRVMKLSLFSGMIPTSECPTFAYQKPNVTELQRYKEEYLKPGIPYSFDDNPFHEYGGRHSPQGFVIGMKQAKFFIIDPASAFFRPPFDVRIFQRINDQFLQYHKCNSRGNVIWLMSRTTNPTSAEVEAIIQSRPELVRLQRQWFCATS